MALVTPTRTFINTDPECEQWSWTLTTADTTGVAVSWPAFGDTTWHAVGTWGGATAAVQGSNTDTDGLFAAISNANGGTAITWTVDGAVKTALERPLYMRPKLTTAGVGATVVVTVTMRRMPR
jgi:hypothetical protein